jgi:hypothetical protein
VVEVVNDGSFGDLPGSLYMRKDGAVGPMRSAEELLVDPTVKTIPIPVPKLVLPPDLAPGDAPRSRVEVVNEGSSWNHMVSIRSPESSPDGYPEWLKVIHAANEAYPDTFDEPLVIEKWAGGTFEEYDDARVIHHDDGSVTIVAKTERGELALRAAAGRVARRGGCLRSRTVPNPSVQHEPQTPSTGKTRLSRSFPQAL